MLRINNFLFYERPNNHNGLSKDIQNFFVYIMIRLQSMVPLSSPRQVATRSPFVCLLVCLIFLFCYQSFAHGLSVHAVLNQMVQYPQIPNYYFLCVLHTPLAQNRLQNMGIIIVEKDTQNVSMTLAWVIFIIS